MYAKEFLIKNKVDTSYVETFCNKNGWGKINLEDLLNSFIEHYKQSQALQLQQTGVMPRFISLVTSFDFNSINEKIDWLGIKREDIISLQHTKKDGFCLYYFKNEA